MELQKFTYDNRLSKMFLQATFFWGIVGTLVGLTIAFELIFPHMSAGISWLSFGRLRPLHTNAVVFAFVGNGMFTGMYYSTPRLLKTPMYSELLGRIHFWGWQLIILAAAITLPLGYTVSKEYAELEWPIDIAIAIVWVIFGINLIMTMVKRRTQHIYVAIWFYIATFVTVAVLHIVNSINIPVSFLKSYPVYAGVQDALVQWWYGHNAVAFFLTTPYLGLMYYFIPKAANRPVYSYKLSIIHFWALIFLYIWAGPHHLLYSALPDWAQALGTAFSVMLIAPSWGGMINGLLTLRGAWDKVRESPVLKMFVVAVTAYGMSTFEGPLLSLKSVNAISHFTDWTIAHVHIGALGWNGMLTFGMIYWLVPRLFNTQLYSKKMANAHFWLATSGMLFFAVPLYFAAFTQSLMWKEFTADGFLKYPNFIETVVQILPMYYLRATGGTLYVTGIILLIINVLKTMKMGTFVKTEDDQAPALKLHKDTGHRFIESKPVLFTTIALVVILIGGIVEFVPMFMVKSNVPTIAAVQPYTPLELEGRDIYVREGCYLCHSQMVRPFRSEVERYGDYSKAGEAVYDHPFQFGSKRTGPDLAREGVKSGKNYKPDSWHYNHFFNPQKMVAQSIMPPYPWIINNSLNTSLTAKKIRVMQTLGVPYPEGYAEKAVDDLKKQAATIAQGLRDGGIDVSDDKEVIALIAYIQRLGTDIYKDK
ncbi:MAG: cytochrome-c oxidase, cbb3-type subunit I [Bacteroidales bacterium]|nr:cytochrome-c oxidase, cbb3-type subunit I [Bacteroidales bacterium]